MINHWMSVLVEELATDGVPDPLTQSFPLSAIWDDLCRLAGERPPDQVRVLVGDDDVTATSVQDQLCSGESEDDNDICM